MSLQLNIDRTTDEEIAIIKCTLDEVDLCDTYFFDPTLADEVITSTITADLILKGYSIS